MQRHGLALDLQYCHAIAVFHTTHTARDVASISVAIKQSEKDSLKAITREREYLLSQHERHRVCDCVVGKDADWRATDLCWRLRGVRHGAIWDECLCGYVDTVQECNDARESEGKMEYLASRRQCTPAWRIQIRLPKVAMPLWSSRSNCT